MALEDGDEEQRNLPVRTAVKSINFVYFHFVAEKRRRPRRRTKIEIISARVDLARLGEKKKCFGHPKALGHTPLSTSEMLPSEQFRAIMKNPSKSVESHCRHISLPSRPFVASLCNRVELIRYKWLSSPRLALLFFWLFAATMQSLTRKKSISTASEQFFLGNFFGLEMQT